MRDIMRGIRGAFVPLAIFRTTTLRNDERGGGPPAGSGEKISTGKVLFRFSDGRKASKRPPPQGPQKAVKMGNFSNSLRSNMKKFLSILTLFVNGAKGADKTAKKDNSKTFLIISITPGTLYTTGGATRIGRAPVH